MIFKLQHFASWEASMVFANKTKRQRGCGHCDPNLQRQTSYRHRRVTWPVAQLEIKLNRACPGLQRGSEDWAWTPLSAGPFSALD